MERPLRRSLRLGAFIALPVLIVAVLAGTFFLPYPVFTETRAATLTVSHECYEAHVANVFGDGWSAVVVETPSLESDKSHEGRLAVKREGLFNRRNHSTHATFTLKNGEVVPMASSSKSFFTASCRMRPGDPSPFQPRN